MSDVAPCIHSVPRLVLSRTASSSLLRSPKHSPVQEEVLLAQARDEAVSSCTRHALYTFARSFAVAYGLRMGVSLVFRLIVLLRKSPRSLLSLSTLLDERHLVARTESVRLGLLSGGFAGLYSLAHCALRHVRKDDGYNRSLAGFIAGFALVAQSRESRRTIALYVCARLVQCLYNAAKIRGWFSPLKHGDSLLFIITSAQVMYAYVMRPETLPQSYLSFIRATGPIDTTILTAVKHNNRHMPFNLDAVRGYLAPKYMTTVAAAHLVPHASPAIIPCAVLHPMTEGCVANSVRVFKHVFVRTFPLYLSISLVPSFLFRPMQTFRQPVAFLQRGLLSCVRSLAFLGAFTMTYQQTVCLYRKLFDTDHRLEYFVAGLVAPCSVFMERKSRRSELALYVLPRAADSLWMSLQSRRFLPRIPGGDILLFCLSAGGLMYFFSEEPETMSPLMKTVIEWVFGVKRGQALKCHSMTRMALAPVPGEEEETKGSVPALPRVP